MAEQALDLRSSAGYLRQRRRILAGGGALGLVLGLCYAMFVPPQLSSTALVLYPGGNGTSNEGEIVTQVHIVVSSPVLEQAGASVTPRLSASAVAKRLSVDALTSQLIQIRASAHRAGEAQALTQAVAQAYIDVSLASTRSVTEATQADLRTRETALTGQVKALQTEITTTAARMRREDAESDVGRRDAQLLGQLTSEQADIALQLDKVKESLALSADQMLAGTAERARVVQPAAPAEGPPRYARLAIGGVIGAASGLALLAGMLLIRLRRDPRLRTRDDLADAVGSHVLASVRSRPQRSVAEWSTLFETYDASSVDAWAFRQMLRGVVAPGDATVASRGRESEVQGRVEHPSSITILALAGDLKAVAIAPQLAVVSASFGIQTRLVVSASPDCPASLLAACASDRADAYRAGLILETSAHHELSSAMSSASNGATAEPAHLDRVQLSHQAERKPVSGDRTSGVAARLQQMTRQRSGHRDGDLAPGSTATFDRSGSAHPAAQRDSVAMTVVLAVVDRADPSLKGLSRTDVTVLALSPGTCSREELARLAVATDDAGRRFGGIIVADPDTADRTTGRRTLDQRVRSAPLPLRTTGISQVAMPTGDRGGRS